MSTALDLLKNRNERALITFSDGLVAAIHSCDDSIVITSPNSRMIYEPPLGSTRDLVRREDGFYADDDYVRWPQPWNAEFCHLSVIPLQPCNTVDGKYSQDCVMWDQVSVEDVIFEDENCQKNHPLSPCKLPSRFVDHLHNSNRRLRERFERFRAQSSSNNSVLTLADVYLAIIDICLLALQIPRSLRDIRRGVAEIQRAWLSCSALIDYMQIYHPRLKETRGGGRVADEVIGASTGDPLTARALFNAGIPVYLTRQIRELGNANILRIVQPLSGPTLLCCRDANPPYQMIYMGPAGSNGKFHAILHAAQTCFYEKSVLDRGIHYQSQYRSSWSLGMSLSQSVFQLPPSIPSSCHRTQHSPPRKNTPFSRVLHKVERSAPTVNSLWCRLPKTSYAPCVLPNWAEQLLRIDTVHPERHHKGASPPRSFIVPPAHLFFRPDGTVRRENIAQWSYFRASWYDRCQAESSHLNPKPTATWKELLILPVHNRSWDANREPVGKLEQSRHDAWHTLTSTMDIYSQPKPSHYICQMIELPEANIVRASLWELTEIAFRFELKFIDEAIDTSSPVAHTFTAYAAFQMAKANHSNHRSRLFNNIFEEPGLFPLNEFKADTGVASAIPAARLKYTYALWILMESWPFEKPDGWNLVDDGISTHSPLTLEWENTVIRYYLQSAFNCLGYIPTLPHNLKS